MGRGWSRVVQQISEQGGIVGDEYFASVSMPGRSLTFVPDKKQHGHTDEVQYSEARVFREYAVPDPQGEGEGQLAREYEPEPASFVSSVLSSRSAHIAHICASTPSVSRRSHSWGSIRRRRLLWMWLQRIMMGA
jgi:hypothetical protein